MKTSLLALGLLLVLSGCALTQPALVPEPDKPKAPKVAAWILEPVPSSLPLLDELIPPYEKTSAKPKSD